MSNIHALAIAHAIGLVTPRATDFYAHARPSYAYTAKGDQYRPGTPGKALRKAKRKAQKIARRANRK